MNTSSFIFLWHRLYVIVFIYTDQKLNKTDYNSSLSLGYLLVIFPLDYQSKENVEKLLTCIYANTVCWITLW